MIPATSSLRLFLFAFCLLIFDFCCAYPTPYSYTSTVFPRQGPGLTSPVTVTKTQRITTGVGIFLQTCEMTLTPTTVDGADMVRQEEKCSLTHDNGNGHSSSAPPPGSSGTPSSTPNVVSPISTVTGLPPAGSGSVPLPAVSITLTSVPLSPSSSSGVVLPSSGVPAGGIGISSVSNPTATLEPENAGSSIVTLPSSSSSLSPTATAENSGAAAFDPPGKKLQVLPIGLGVFAGVSAIALIVVGVVTYERTKHRRNFRKLKLQEAGRMGYGTT